MNTILLDFGDSDEAELLLNNLKYFARVEGITQKRIFLLGVASYIQERGTSPELIVQIADYLALPRAKARAKARKEQS